MRRVRRLRLHDFRSYSQADIAFSGGPVAFFGPNGAGKTNLLEALSFLGPGRGMRRASGPDVARQGGEGGWGVSADIAGADAACGDDAPTTLTVRAVPPRAGRKQVTIEGAGAPATAMLDHLRFMWLTPAQDRLFADTPGERRRFLDRLVLGGDAGHARTVLAYEHALRQRQAALLNDGPPSVLAAFEREMAVHGAAMVASRRRAVERLGRGMDLLPDVAFPSATLALDLGPSVAAEEGDPTPEALSQAIARSRPRDREAGRALVGAHRGDLLVHHRAKDQAAAQCSTGEQKALLIGIVLAHAMTLRTGIDGPTVLLLDEVAAHLDPARREALATLLGGTPVQAFMTGTERTLFQSWQGQADFFEVSDGRVTPAE